MTIEKVLSHFKPERKNLLPALKKIQLETGYVSKEAIEKCADFFELKKTDVYSTASFYDQINTKKAPTVVISVCDGANCSSKRSEEIIKEIEKIAGIREGDDFNPLIKLRRESCFGLCTQGPVIKVGETIFEKVSAEIVDEILRPYLGHNSEEKENKKII